MTIPIILHISSTQPKIIYIYGIKVPPKMWRPKPQNRYNPLDYGIEVDNGVSVFFSLWIYSVPSYG